ncbi:hypothetical protein EDB84DRAFT_928969 [Lactarius hengduanensis]|nr:hypothetical protein EDB84DRAFT_928969 [Lactarius hengduanensis]
MVGFGILHRPARKNPAGLECPRRHGLIGLVAGYFGARVYITDQGPLIPIMERNIALSNLQSSVRRNYTDQSRYPSTSHSRILSSRPTVYFEPAFLLLVATLAPGDGDEATITTSQRRRGNLDNLDISDEATDDLGHGDEVIVVASTTATRQPRPWLPRRWWGEYDGDYDGGGVNMTAAERMRRRQRGR